MTESCTAPVDRGSWTDQGAHRVAAGVYRMPLPLPTDGLRAVNVYAVEAGDGIVLVDSGWAVPAARGVLVDALAELGADLGDISRCLVTHFHRDHYTYAVELRRELGIPVSLGIGEEPSVSYLCRPDARTFSQQRQQLATCGAQPLLQRLLDDGYDAPVPQRQYEEPDTWLRGPDTLQLGDRTLRALPTPGHTRGHMVFADMAAGLLFAGDHVLPTITPSVGFEPVSNRSPLSDYLESLRLVRDLPDLLLLPAHGPVAPSAHARIDELLQHHDERLDACASLVASGLDTAYAVAQAMPWTRRARRFGELDPFNQMLATIEALAHLDVLATQGRLRASVDDDVRRYGT